MTPFDLLSEPIRKFIRDKGWEKLRPIQAAAIKSILTTDCNYILASRTASGKTEAAFLPILSKVDFNAPGVQVLYISPLVALINDQFDRIEQLCKYLEVTVTKWHGEANKTLKERIIKQPNGVVLITPESLEAMFVNKRYNVKHLFSNLKFVVIDEIHSFIGTDRGIQLKSILSRVQNINGKAINIIGLSATIGDYNEAKKFTGDEFRTKVLLDKTAKEINGVFRYFESKTEELPLALLKDLYIETKDNKALIFPNSRGRVEEVAVKLKKISVRVKGHPNYFSHHSSVHKEVREYVEYFAKNNNRQNFCIACTSTLELGIDIGAVDLVVQIDSTHNVASLAQRLGRSGRQDGEHSNLFLYNTNEWSLLQSLACWSLYKEGYIEPPQAAPKPYDILLHQALSISKGHSGIRLTDLVKELKENWAFNQIELFDVEEIITHLIQIDFLERLQSEVIIGVEGEKVVNNKEFYSVFKAEENFKVVNAGNIIGEVPFSPEIKMDQNILLAAKIWKIKFVDDRAKKIEVVPAKDGKKPLFFGSGAAIHQKIREKMLEVLYSSLKYDMLDGRSDEKIKAMRNDFSVFDIQNLENERPLLIKNKRLYLFTFTGTRINRTLKLLFDAIYLENTLDDNSSSFLFEVSKQVLVDKFGLLPETILNIDTHITNTLETSPGISDFSKWGQCLPLKFQVRLLRDRYYDVEETEKLLAAINLIENK